jgi:putative NADH-flavin reductase
MKILIVGATGRTGKELVKQALEQGHEVTALVRSLKKITISQSNLRIVKGDVLDFDNVQKAVAGQDAVLSALGHKKFFIKTSILSEGTRNIIRAMDQHKVKRLICITTLGISDSRFKLGLYYTLFVIPFIVFFYFHDKVKQERLIKEVTYSGRLCVQDN